MNLSVVMRKWRINLELDPADAAQMIGIPTRALTKFEKDGTIDMQNFFKLLSWLTAGAPVQNGVAKLDLQVAAEELAKDAAGGESQLEGARD